MVTLYYEEAVFAPALGARASTFATCLPLQFSAAFFMAVLPAALSGRDLLVFPPHDWRPVVEAARRGPVVCQSVPAITAAGALSLGEPVNASNLLILMGGGYATEPRVKSVRDRFRGAILGNIYGTAETGALSIDWTPGEVDHVGRPITGKPVWVLDPNEQGIGVIATTGPDCRRFQWTPGSSIEELGDIASGTDYGHFSDDGYLYLDGRLDGGEKLHGVTVYPRAVERHILRLPGVIDVRVTVRRTGGVDQLVARVVGDLTPAEVQEGCAQRQEIERPTRVECFPERDALSAYSANGKL
jgi:acyl-coenzyme A synthetase/AMP-(fatty) acid ligase